MLAYLSSKTNFVKMLEYARRSPLASRNFFGTKVTKNSLDFDREMRGARAATRGKHATSPSVLRDASLIKVKRSLEAQQAHPSLNSRVQCNTSLRNLDYFARHSLRWVYVGRTRLTYVNGLASSASNVTVRQQTGLQI